ncbi:hypothetical protein [Pyrococcus abyssi]|uniref:Uncharacterized protein n=1 Tax=Pyrococcus abyssi (strain GE5 / Orsay) TaxID=272844 RepID=Q9UZ91_PYRAB|nr:hypothetical protein [Pyrococcus abyssi]CAB50168.1 Hypothetical protein PAB0833 [Pyrococcus abyssi GE5]CCE70700.1 TPA: hypothetical protein PAB0833 [Pyrococcus abyssi GE5]
MEWRRDTINGWKIEISEIFQTNDSFEGDIYFVANESELSNLLYAGSPKVVNLTKLSIYFILKRNSEVRTLLTLCSMKIANNSMTSTINYITNKSTTIKAHIIPKLYAS